MTCLVQAINSVGTSVSTVLTTPTASAGATSGDGASGSQNTGTTAPVIAGPASNPWDQQGANSTLNIPVTVHLPSASGGGGTGGTGNPGDATGTTAFRIADMMERFGVNTFSSLSATTNMWGAYPSDYSAQTAIAGINAVLGKSNMTMNVREYHYAGRESIQSIWCPAVAGGTGAKFSMCIGQGGSDSDVASMIALAQSSSSGSNPWLRWLEGINEPNGVGTVSQSVTATAQADIWTNGHNLPGISIMGPSVVIGLPRPDGYIAGWAAASDIATLNANSSIINVHFYPNTLPSLDDGTNRGGEINDVYIGEHNAWGTTDPEIITEWHPTYYNSNSALQFNEAYNGYYAPIFILEAWRLGFEGYFWFSLFDFGSTTCGLIAQNTGVSPAALTLRDGALAIQAMYELTGPASATKHTFTPGKLHYTASGLPVTVNAASPNTGGQTMLFQNDAGQFLLFVWNAQVAPGGAAAPVRITFSGNRTKIVEYNITNAGNNQTAVQTVTEASSITLQLAADVHLLVITY